MDGCFSHRIAQLLIDETTVQAVVGTRRRVHPETMLAFIVSFYAQSDRRRERARGVPDGVGRS